MCGVASRIRGMRTEFSVCLEFRVTCTSHYIGDVSAPCSLARCRESPFVWLRSVG